MTEFWENLPLRQTSAVSCLRRRSCKLFEGGYTGWICMEKPEEKKYGT